MTTTVTLYRHATNPTTLVIRWTTDAADTGGGFDVHDSSTTPVPTQTWNRVNGGTRVPSGTLVLEAASYTSTARYIKVAVYRANGTLAEESNEAFKADGGLSSLPVDPGSTPPASAGSDQSGVKPFDTVTLTGTGGTGASWAQTGGSPTVTLGGSGATRTFTAPATLEGTTLTFDYGGDTMTVTVLPHNEWTWDAGGVMRPLIIDA